ncbi:MAG: hypothetical protein MUO31_14105 [Thermodesulfovibrionales bacterium]|nr:hypothetical protein [Thermodesulfovibrionales bacterium]
MNQKRFDGLMNEILKFRDQRDWAQFHDPKNLAEAIYIKLIWRENAQG